jgi:hypothetical protein
MNSRFPCSGPSVVVAFAAACGLLILESAGSGQAAVPPADSVVELPAGQPSGEFLIRSEQARDLGRPSWEQAQITDG